MPKFIDDPVGTVIGGIGAGLSGLGSKLGFGKLNTGSASVDPNAAGNDGMLAQLYRQAQAEQSGKVGQPAAAKKGGKVSSASKRADGCAQRGKTRGRIV